MCVLNLGADAFTTYWAKVLEIQLPGVRGKSLACYPNNLSVSLVTFTASLIRTNLLIKKKKSGGTSEAGHYHCGTKYE